MGGCFLVLESPGLTSTHHIGFQLGHTVFRSRCFRVLLPILIIWSFVTRSWIEFLYPPATDEIRTSSFSSFSPSPLFRLFPLLLILIRDFTFLSSTIMPDLDFLGASADWVRGIEALPNKMPIEMKSAVAHITNCTVRMFFKNRLRIPGGPPLERVSSGPSSRACVKLEFLQHYYNVVDII